MKKIFINSRWGHMKEREREREREKKCERKKKIYI